MTSELNFLFGRGMNTTSDVYVLPADPEELSRLTLQHRIWKLMHGGAGLYPFSVAKQVEEALSGNDGRQPVVLDVGTGSGIWVLEMAERFANAHVVGLDISGNAPVPRPTNCRFTHSSTVLLITSKFSYSFVKEDISKHNPNYIGQFDIIHARNFLSHLSNPDEVLKDLALYLRPGGILLLLNAHCWKDDNWEMLHPAQNNVSEEGRSWVARWSREIRFSSSSRKYPTKDEDSSLLVDFVPIIQNNTNFYAIGIKDSLAPIGWSGHGIENGEQIGEMMRKNTKLFVESGKPALFRTGIPKETVENWATNVLSEIEVAKVYMQWSSIWAFKS